MAALEFIDADLLRGHCAWPGHSEHQTEAMHLEDPAGSMRAQQRLEGQP